MEERTSADSPQDAARSKPDPARKPELGEGAVPDGLHVRLDKEVRAMPRADLLQALAGAHVKCLHMGRTLAQALAAHYEVNQVTQQMLTKRLVTPQTRMVFQAIHNQTQRFAEGHRRILANVRRATGGIMADDGRRHAEIVAESFAPPAAKGGGDAGGSEKDAGTLPRGGAGERAPGTARGDRDGA